MTIIKVWCEYDISGGFGSNNNECVFYVSNETSVDDIHKMVEKYITSYVDEDINGLYDWEFIGIPTLPHI